MATKKIRIALIISFCAAFLGPWLLSGVDIIFTSSYIYLFGLIFLGFLSESAALVVFLGYLLGDISHCLMNGNFSLQGLFVIGQLSKFALLYCLLVVTPSLAYNLSHEKKTSRVWTPVLHVVIAAFLIYLWCQAGIVLARSVFLWSFNIKPTIESIQSIQEKYLWMMSAGCLALVFRYAFADVAFCFDNSIKMSRALLSNFLRKPLSRIIFTITLLWFLFSGMYSSWFDGILTLLILSIYEIGLFESLIQSVRPKLSFLMKFNLMVKFCLGCVFSYAISYGVLKIFSGTESFRPILISVLLSLGIFYFLLPKDQYLFFKEPKHEI